jgi:hypothetical protein
VRTKPQDSSHSSAASTSQTPASRLPTSPCMPKRLSECIHFQLLPNPALNQTTKWPHIVLSRTICRRCTRPAVRQAQKTGKQQNMYTHKSQVSNNRTHVTASLSQKIPYRQARQSLRNGQQLLAAAAATCCCLQLAARARAAASTSPQQQNNPACCQNLSLNNCLQLQRIRRS